MMNEKALTWEEAVQWLKSQPGQKELIEACYYDLPLIGAAKRFAESEEWLAVCELLSGWIPGRVLDLGAGNGIASYAFASAGCAVTALEPDPSNIVGAGAIKQLSQEANLPINVVESFGEKLPFENASFDIVHCRQVLHHAADLNQLCRELARVLRPGGVLIATREHVISKSEDLDAFLTSHPLHELYGGENAFLLKQYRQAISDAGFTIKNVYGPQESVINYFPTTKGKNQERITAVLQKYAGKSVAKALASQESFIALVNRFRTWRDHSPGRLYTFVAVKPQA
ncbi:class I SAM-dependent methyltransferase [Microcoleus sp. FACHB-672]|uniref:class I SAM-dependent methyltransferase n=1 Tax=Microcoleus sp. FACHB-672 TaxID=2692825 RepID=UPI0018F01248|nr:class I SAM-dependent methyltransferase [Microcoleus sp. FACHB-672]